LRAPQRKLVPLEVAADPAVVPPSPGRGRVSLAPSAGVTAPLQPERRAYFYGRRCDRLPSDVFTEVDEREAAMTDAARWPTPTMHSDG
jgi:hypothetical protein